MSSIKFSHKGDFTKTEKYFARMEDPLSRFDLNKYGKEGVEALKAATPKDTGQTSESWTYGITKSKGECAIYWTNTNVNNGVNIAVILQYGHGTRNGGYVKGRNYINPAIRPIFDKIAEDSWKEVTSIK